MSQSPLSPAGKRLRTMNATDEDSDEQDRDLLSGFQLFCNHHRRHHQKQNQRLRHGDQSSSSAMDFDRGADANPDYDDEDDEDTHNGHNHRGVTDSEILAQRGMPLIRVDPGWEDRVDRMVASYFGSPDGESDTDTSEESAEAGVDAEEEEEEENDDEEDDRSEDYDPLPGRGGAVRILENDADYMSDDSSGYQDYHGVMGPPDYDNDDDDDDSITIESEEEDDEINQCLPDEYLKHDPTPESPYPKPEWITVNELKSRRYGFASSRHPIKRPNMYWFEKYASNSLWMIQRLQLEKKLQSHTAPVNCLDFNSSGSLICSGSDDLDVCIWDWQARCDQIKSKIATGHTNSIFQSQFCNFNGSIITSSRDGTVRLINIETNLSEIIMSSSGEIGSLAFITPQTLVTCGTNASVNFIDLRAKEAKKLFVVRTPNNHRSCPLHSISSHPLDKHRIAAAGSSPYVFLYDLRRVGRSGASSCEIDNKPTYCLGNFEDAYSHHIVTSTAFNSTGDKLLISYNDDDLYVCRTDTCEMIHKYQGHRNKRTIKGCTWFGDKFVLSGSDDGHIYGWDLQSEHIVCFLEGDNGVVNCLSVHPDLPILASCGYDHDIKIWEPVSSIWPQTLKGIKPQICKNTMRRQRANARRFREPLYARDDTSDTDL